MRVFVVRHGETVGNLEGRHQGWTDFPLTELGKKQAREAARLLASEGISKIYSSDLGRALETAKIIAEAAKAKLEKTSELREMSFGIFDGMKKEEISARFPEMSAQRQADKLNYSYPKGESYIDVKKRLANFLEKLMETHASDSIVLVAHDAVNRVILRLLLGLSDLQMLRIKQPNDCIYLIDERKNVSAIVGGKKSAGFLERQ